MNPVSNTRSQAHFPPSAPAQLRRSRRGGFFVAGGIAFSNLLAIVLISAAPLFEQDYPSGKFRGGGEMSPNVTLPAQVAAPMGELTCFADFTARKDHTVPVYVVNRTDKSVDLSSQDGDIFLKLECARPDGTWQRAQAHLSSWCGNSYYLVTLPPGQFLLIRSYSPDYGTPAQVRFARYGSDGVSLVSNVGQGFIFDRDIADAETDFIGRRICPTLDTLLEATFDGTPKTGDSPSRQVAAIRLMQAAGRNPHFEQVAAALAKTWEKENPPDSEKTRAAADIRHILEKPSAAPRDWAALFDRCVAAVLHPDEHRKDFGWPENHPDLVWRVLTDLAQARRIPDIEKWRPLFDEALQHPDPSRLAQTSDLLGIPWLANELLPTEFLETILYQPDSRLQSLSAGSLAQRGQLEYLVYAGWRLNPEGQLSVFSALSQMPAAGFGASVHNPQTNDERAFWAYCLRTQPFPAIQQLASVFQEKGREYNPYDSTVRRAVSDFLTETATREAGADFDNPSYDTLRRALLFLASWKKESDNPVFLKYLEHGGYTKSEFWKNEGIRHGISYSYPLRQAAKEILLQRGQPLPPGIVTGKEVPF